MGNETDIIPIERIERTIIVLRGHRVILDENLAELYEVEVKVLNQAVKRNSERFPEDFMFRLNDEEALFLRSQIVTIKHGRGQHRKYHPLAFTEQGVAMLSSVLRSTRAVRVNIEIMRALIKPEIQSAIKEFVSGTLNDMGILYGDKLSLGRNDVQIFERNIDCVQIVRFYDPKNTPGCRRNGKSNYERHSIKIFR